MYILAHIQVTKHNSIDCVILSRIRAKIQKLRVATNSQLTTVGCICSFTTNVTESLPSEIRNSKLGAHQVKINPKFESNFEVKHLKCFGLLFVPSTKLYTKILLNYRQEPNL